MEPSSLSPPQLQLQLVLGAAQLCSLVSSVWIQLEIPPVMIHMNSRAVFLELELKKC